MPIAETYNQSRYDPGDERGFYESYFVRANHPLRPLGFWVRYTVFSPKGRPRDASAELWAVWFDGETGKHRVAKAEVPAQLASFSRERLDVAVVSGDIGVRGSVQVHPPRGRATLQIASAWMRKNQVRGMAQGKGHRLEWDLKWQDTSDPVFLVARKFYDLAFPRAKALCGSPNARFTGTLTVDGEKHRIEDWVGSQNHNWGSRHTDRYAWGQVCGFDNAPDSFLEVATVRLRAGPIWLPHLTTLVLRHEGQELALNTLPQALFRARGRFDDFEWAFHSRAAGLDINGLIRAPREAFVGLRYGNPPGGTKICLNTKLASCRVTVTRDGHPPLVLESRQRAAFEMLTDNVPNGLEIRA